MKSNNSKKGNSEISSEFETHIDSIKGSGQLLPESMRAFFEPRFGYDFSNVRVHTDIKAAKSAKKINAKAYTSGNNIVLDSGEYSPKTKTGQELLAHELTHVVQQSFGQSPNMILRTTGDGHDLTNPRFKGDQVLEACYDNERFLYMGHRGGAVEKIQQALVELGFPLPIFGADGIFGSETNAAVKEYQKSRGLQADGIVGPKTMGRLDGEPRLASPSPQPIPPNVKIPLPTVVMSKAGMMRMAADSNTASNDLVWKAVGKLNDMRNEVEKNRRYPTPSEPTWRAYEGVRTYQYSGVTPNDISAFIRDVDKTIMYMIWNANFPAVPVEDVVEPTMACIPEKDYARAYVNARHPKLNYYDPSIYYCYYFYFAAGPQCRRSVTTHERFHLVGLFDGKEEPGEPGKAIFNANNMNELTKYVMNKPLSPCPSM